MYEPLGNNYCTSRHPVPLGDIWPIRCVLMAGHKEKKHRSSRARGVEPLQWTDDDFADYDPKYWTW